MKLVTDYVAEIKSKFGEGITTGAAYFEKVCINFKVLLHFFSVNHPFLNAAVLFLGIVLYGTPQGSKL